MFYMLKFKLSLSKITVSTEIANEGKGLTGGFSKCST